MSSTLIQYDPSDGVGTNVGDLNIRNAIALISKDGKAVSLLITIINSGSRSALVTLQFQSGGKKTTVQKPVFAGKVASFGNTPDEEQLIVLNPGVKAGELFPVYVQSGDNPGTQLLVPVLEPTGEYSTLAPPEILR